MGLTRLFRNILYEFGNKCQARRSHLASVWFCQVPPELCLNLLALLLLLLHYLCFFDFFFRLCPFEVEVVQHLFDIVRLVFIGPALCELEAFSQRLEDGAYDSVKQLFFLDLLRHFQL